MFGSVRDSFWSNFTLVITGIWMIIWNVCQQVDCSWLYLLRCEQHGEMFPLRRQSEKSELGRNSSIYSWARYSCAVAVAAPWRNAWPVAIQSTVNLYRPLPRINFHLKRLFAFPSKLPADPVWFLKICTLTQADQKRRYAIQKNAFSALSVAIPHRALTPHTDDWWLTAARVQLLACTRRVPPARSGTCLLSSTRLLHLRHTGTHGREPSKHWVAIRE